MTTRLFGPDGRTPVDVVNADPVQFTFSITPQFVGATGLGLVRASLGHKHDLDAVALTVFKACTTSDPQPDESVVAIIRAALAQVATPVSYLTPQQARVVGMGLISTAEQSTGLATMIRAFIDMGRMDLTEAVGAAQALLSGVRDEHRAYEEHVQQERARRAETAREEAEAGDGTTH